MTKWRGIIQPKSERRYEMHMKRIAKRASWLLSAMLVFSLLVPALASAAIRFNGSFSYDGSLYGQVQFDGTVGDSVYGQDDVTLSVYSTNGQFVKNLSVTYVSYSNGVSFYSVPNAAVIDSVYDAVYLQYGSERSNIIYRESEPDVTDPDPDNSGGGGGSGDSGSGNNGGTGGSGGSGGGTTDPAPGDSTIDTDEDGTVDGDKLKAALEKYTEVTIRVKGDEALIPAWALTSAKTGSVLNIVFDHGSYILPLDAFELEELASQISSGVQDMTLEIGVKPLSASEAEPVTDAIEELGAEQLSDVYVVYFTAKGKNGKSAAVNVFEQYVERIIPLKKKPVKSATIALYHPDTKKLYFVPGSISDTEASFWRTGNSIYVVLELDKTFDDIRSHWAQSDIELLASKLIVEGVTNTKFEPERALTRAEFVALAVRAFGLVEFEAPSSFSDVKSGSWYSGIIAAAAKAGLIEGYEDGTFRPDAPITREELAAIVVRAYEYTGGTIEMDSWAQAKTLAAWDDASSIVWGHREVAQAVSAGFMIGMTDSTLETDGTATRAQTVTMLKRVLKKAEFID